nr:retrovirus-related Pol polyprotein from transposon TNT 1-94 [Tanacetum cinerariifolium]
MESYYTRFYKLMNEMIRNNLTVATMQVNVQFLQQPQPEWLRFVSIVKQQHKLDEVSYHKLFDILKQYQKEVNELCAERLARNTNPLALVSTAQANQDLYYQTSKYHKSYAPSSKPLIPTRSHTTTRHKGKEIAKPITPPFKTASEKDIDPEQAQRDKDMQKILNLIAKTVNVVGARENVGSSVVQQSRIQCFNCKEFRHFAKECRNPKRVKDSTYHKEKMLLCKQAEQGVSLQAEQYDWLADTDEEIDDQELEAHYNYMEKIQELQHSEQSESISNTCLVETDDSNVIPDSPDICEDDIHNDQNGVESDDERVTLANLIANLKLDVDENKKIQKQLKKANTTLAQELKECKTILAETSKSLKESISVRDSCLVALQTKQAEFEKYKAFNDRTVDYDKLELKLNETLEIVDNAWVKHLKDQFRTPNAQDMEILLQTCLMPLAIKTQNDSFLFVHELKQEMHADLKNVESLKKEIDKLESDKVEFSNMYDMILQECVSNDVKCSYLLSLSDLDALDELQCLYLHKVKECDYLAQKLSKQTESISKEVHSEIYNALLKKSTCFVRDLQGNDLLTGNHGSDLYTISLQESTSLTLLCLMAKASSTQAWLWHRRLSYLNFDYINLLSKKDVVIGLPKLRYVKDQLCSSYELSQAKRSSFKSKVVLNLKGRLNLLHMDLCGPMRVANINGKKYILVIIDDYSRYTWTFFLCSKDETPKVLKEFLMIIQRNL